LSKHEQLRHTIKNDKVDQKFQEKKAKYGGRKAIFKIEGQKKIKKKNSEINNTFLSFYFIL